MEDGCKGVHQLGEGATREEADLKTMKGYIQMISIAQREVAPAALIKGPGKDERRNKQYNNQPVNHSMTNTISIVK